MPSDGLKFSFKFEGLDAMLKAAENLGKSGQYAVNRAVDEVGNKVFTVMKRAVSSQTGMTYGRVSTVMFRRQAMGTGSGSFVITARDRPTSLKDFAPRATARGVSAAPWKKRRVFPHTFLGPGGHVYKNTHKFNKKSGRYNAIEKLWGPAIPLEMINDESARTFYA